MKPLLARLIVEAPLPFGCAFSVGGDNEIEKSWTYTVNVAVWGGRDPLVPVIVTW